MRRARSVSSRSPRFRPGKGPGHQGCGLHVTSEDPSDGAGTRLDPPWSRKDAMCFISPTRHTRRPARTCPRLESLEPRGLLSLASPAFANFRGQVTGSAAADAIAILVRREDFDL